MITAYIALGSNLRDPLDQVQRAINALSTLPKTYLKATSSYYRTPPYGPQDQPDYLNAVVQVDTELSAVALLDHTQRIELEQGRERKDERWGPRTLDLDILLFGQEQWSTPRLTIPHYDMHNRAFILVPLVELAPDIQITANKTARQLLAELNSDSIRRW